MEKFKRQYSGALSVEFWDFINSIEDEELRDCMYGLGCQLQDIEHTLLKKLNALHDLYQNKEVK